MRCRENSKNIGWQHSVFFIAILCIFILQNTIGEYLKNTTLQIEIQFVLDVTMIRATGEIVWSKPYANGSQFGVLFHKDENIDELIISEMKQRRKKEVLQDKFTKIKY
ncbi:hypothetical protein [Lysinibacillus telephonicus]|uniref:hypothetical protein n=1 Tax=Lysinibacillus telephonicus TaxID=1714840 RepID=UPI003B9E97C4